TDAGSVKVDVLVNGGIVAATMPPLTMTSTLTEEEQLSPNEYYNLVHSAKKNTRKRAAGQLTRPEKKESEW
ncbi:MAG: hypothetical protein IJT04_03070, partial [Bacteroidales bacterium]|nr:hypothetical protein [Bacteroidales bacterium]